MNIPAQAPVPVRQTSPAAIRVAGWMVLLVPVMAFALVWFRFAVNVPKWDDHALKNFLLLFQQETTLSGKVYQVFKQHNEHRIVWDRLITWLDYTLFGKLSYVHLMAVGNLSLVGLLAIFGLVIRQEDERNFAQIGQRSIWYAVPVACLLFNLAQWENMFWGMAALQNFSILLWVAGSIYLLAYTRHEWAALGLSVLATLTSGNGLVIWPITLGILLHQVLTSAPRIRSWQPLIRQTVGALVSIGLYFTGYQKPDVTPSAKVGPAQLIQGWLAFTGSAAEAFPLGSPFRNCVLLGGMMLMLVLVFALTLIRQQGFSRPWPPAAYFFVGMAGFLLATGAVVTWSRVGFSLETLITSRYKIYSLSLLSLLFVYAVVTLPRRFQRVTLWTGLAAGGTLAWLSYPAYIDQTRRLQQYLLTSQFNWTYTENRPVSTIDAQTAQLINNAPAPYDRCLDQVFGPATAAVTAPDTLYETGTGYLVSFTTSLPVHPGGQTIYIRLRSNRHTWLAAGTPVLNPSRWAGLGLANRFRPGVTAMIQQTDFPGGTYQIDVLTVPDTGPCQLHPTGRSITLSGTPLPTRRTNW